MQLNFNIVIKTTPLPVIPRKKKTPSSQNYKKKSSKETIRPAESFTNTDILGYESPTLEKSTCITDERQASLKRNIFMESQLPQEQTNLDHEHE